MMKKVWLILLAVVFVFGLALLGCGSSGGGGGGDDNKVENPIVDGAKFIRISGRSENWHTLDIKAGKTPNTGFTAGKKHTIKVYGKAPKNTGSIQYTNTDSPYASHSGSVTAAGADGMFIIDREFTVAELTDSGQNGIRISVPENVKSFDIYEVTIVDEDGTSVYKMSEDAEIQDLDAGETQLFKDPAVGGGSKWFWKAGTPKISIMVPGEEEGGEDKCECGGDKTKCNCGEDCDCEECEMPPVDSTFFDNAVGLKTGIGIYGTGDHAFDAETGILTVKGNGGFSVVLPDGFTVADTVSIQYACLLVDGQEVKFIKKQAGGWTDVTPAGYPSFDTTEVSTITVTGFSAAGVTDGKVYFQTNGNFEAKLKIISVTKIAGADIKIDAAVPGLKPLSGETPKTTVETAQYTGAVTWKDASNAAVTGNFAMGGVYTATITLTAKTSYTFEGVAADAIAVTGADSSSHPAGDGKTLTITAIFPAAAGIPAPLVVTNPVFNGWGGLGSAGENNTFDMDTSAANNCRATYVFPSGVDVYNTIKVEYTLTKKAGEDADTPMKVTIKDSLKDEWGSTTGDDYKESNTDANMVYEALLSKFTSGAITFAHNTWEDGSSSFNITFTKITFSYEE